MSFRKMLATAILATLPVAGHAATLDPYAVDPVDINSDTVFSYTAVFTGGTSVDLDFGFEALSDTGATAALVTLEFGGDVSGLEINWAADDLDYVNGSGFDGPTLSEAVIMTTALGNQEGTVSTEFNLANGLSQVLNIGFNVAGTASQAIILSVQVSPGSTVPLPAALPLFISGLVGVGVIGWRNRRRTRAEALEG